MTTPLTRSDDEARIRSVIEDWSGALRRKDPGGVVANHAADYVQFSLAPPLVSTEGNAEGLAAWFATWQGSLGHELSDLRIAVGGDTAFCHGLARLSGTKSDGQGVELWFRLTLGFRRTGGAWKITHEHESVPFYMDGSFRAAIDLER